MGCCTSQSSKNSSKRRNTQEVRAKADPHTEPKTDSDSEERKTPAVQNCSLNDGRKTVDHIGALIKEKAGLKVKHSAKKARVTLRTRSGFKVQLKQDASDSDQEPSIDLRKPSLHKNESPKSGLAPSSYAKKSTQAKPPRAKRQQAQ
jgi:hypothetical protein